MDASTCSRPGARRAVAAGSLSAAAAYGLARCAAGAAVGAPAPDALVGAVTLGLGALAAAVLGVGCAMLAVTALAAAAGRTWSRTEAVASRLMPAVLRRALVVGVGAGLTLGGGTCALADEIDVGWQVTTDAATHADDPAASPDPVILTSAPQTPAPDAPVATQAPAPAPAPAPEPAPAPVSTPAAATVTVRDGDSLWSITAGLLGHGTSDADIAAAWPRLYEANRDALGPDPGLIHPGDVLAVPSGMSV